MEQWAPVAAQEALRTEVARVPILAALKPHQLAAEVRRLEEVVGGVGGEGPSGSSSREGGLDLRAEHKILVDQVRALGFRSW